MIIPTSIINTGPTPIRITAHKGNSTNPELSLVVGGSKLTVVVFVAVGRVVPVGLLVLPVCRDVGLVLVDVEIELTVVLSVGRSVEVLSVDIESSVGLEE